MNRRSKRNSISSALLFWNSCKTEVRTVNTHNSLWAKWYYKLHVCRDTYWILVLFLIDITIVFEIRYCDGTYRIRFSTHCSAADSVRTDQYECVARIQSGHATFAMLARSRDLQLKQSRHAPFRRFGFGQLFRASPVALRYSAVSVASILQNLGGVSRSSRDFSTTGLWIPWIRTCVPHFAYCIVG